jgi:hypothetical protein
MSERETQFLRDLEERLRENRTLAERSLLPKQLSGVASYLAFHTFRSLFFLSLLAAIGLFWRFYEQLMMISKLVFWYE